MKTTHNLLLRDIQHTSYHQELNYLLKKHSQCPTLVKQLRLFLDDNKIIRCGGRIHNAPTSDLAKFPYFLPYRAPDPPPLPKAHINEGPPFSVTGIDFMGALYIKDSEKKESIISAYLHVQLQELYTWKLYRTSQ